MGEDVPTHSKGISPKVNVREQVKFELAYFDATAKHFNHYVTGSLISESLVSFPRLLLGVGLTLLQRYNRCIQQPQPPVMKGWTPKLVSHRWIQFNVIPRTKFFFFREGVLPLCIGVFVAQSTRPSRMNQTIMIKRLRL